MAINYTRLFTTLGKVVGGLNEVNTYRGTTLGTRANTLAARFDAALQDVAEGLYPARDDGRAAMDGWVSYLQQLATDTIVAEVVADRPLVARELAACLVELRRQMVIDAQSLEDSDAAVVVTPTLVNGDALLIGTTLQTDGLPAQLALPDTYNVSVPLGAYEGDTQYSEVIAIQGTTAANPVTNWDWPAGSGIDTTTAILDPHSNLGLTNGRLSSLTGWTQSGGSWTTGAATAAPRPGYTSNVAKFAPSGASGFVSQPVTILGQTVYAWTFKVYKHTSGTQNWSVGVRLKDGAGTTIGSLTQTFTAASLSTGWNIKAGFFVTPKSWSGQASFEVNYSSIVASSNLELAHAGLVAPVSLYPGGPTLVAFSHSQPMSKSDKWVAAVTIGGTGALHRGIDRLVDIKSTIPIGLPTSVTHTQADALVS